MIQNKYKDPKNYVPTLAEKLFFEKVEENLLTPSYLKFVHKQPWYVTALSKITDFPT